MNELIKRARQLPNTIDDLSKFVLVGREKLVAVRAEIRAINKVGLAQEVREQKLAEAQDIAEAVLDAEMRIGELLKDVPKAQGKRTDIKPTDNGVGKYDAIRKAGLNQKQAERFQTLASYPESVQKAKAKARENGDILSRQAVFEQIREDKGIRHEPVVDKYRREAKQRHEQYQKNKHDGVIDFERAVQDQTDKQVVTNELRRNINKACSAVEGIGFFEKSCSIREMAKAMDTDDKENLIRIIQHCIDILAKIKWEVYKA